MILAAIVYVATNGCAWRQLPPVFGASWQTSAGPTTSRPSSPSLRPSFATADSPNESSSKENRSALYEALDALPWRDAPIAHHSTHKGHGRITTRTIQVLPAPPDLPFPHVNQVWLIERHVTATDGTPLSAIAQLGIASPDADMATPTDLAGYNRDHWGIEVLHWIRDTLYREYHSRTRTHSGPRVMASLLNLAIGAFRLAGRTDITEATRWACRYMSRPFAILGLTS